MFAAYFDATGGPIGRFAEVRASNYAKCILSVQRAIHPLVPSNRKEALLQRRSQRMTVQPYSNVDIGAVVKESSHDRCTA